MTSDEIRQAFLRFFEEREHTVIPSSSLVPRGGPEFEKILTVAGMVQIEPYFTGEATPPNVRLASCQKCFRATDIEEVGDHKHLTFFEMLGNFSVGDYFKREAIGWAWEFLTQHLRLPLERLWFSVYLDDDEAYGYWREVGVPEERLVRYGEEDNFWGPAGDSGPCGPCSEIFYDFGEEHGCGKPTCGPNCDCDRFTEVWNLVFTEYNQDAEGHRTPLPKKNIDTGLGLERAAAILQGKKQIYDSDLFAPIVQRVVELSGREYGRDEPTDRAIKIVVEHGRAVAFLIGDGVIPSNEGRGYVLRRVLRRAALFGRKLGLEEPFLAEVAKSVIAQIGHVYPELLERQDFILRVIESEEERFGQTLTIGLSTLEAVSKPFAELAKQVAMPSKEVIEALNDQLQRAMPVKEVIEALNKQLQRPMPSKEVIEALNKQLQRAMPVKEVIEALNKQLQNMPSKEVVEALNKQVQRAMPSKEVIEALNKQVQRAMPSKEVVEALNDQLQRAMPVKEVIEALNKQVQRAMPSKEVIEALNKQVQEVVQYIDKALRIPSSVVFQLYDTYGFPRELTEEIVAENGLDVDEEGFEAEMERQRERSRAALAIKVSERIRVNEQISVQRQDVRQSSFVGYEELTQSTMVVGLVVERQSLDRVSEGQEVDVILAETPFYGEMGGQVGDTGEIRGEKGKVVVTDTFWPQPELIVHRGRVMEGELSVGDMVEAEVDVARRLDIARNHTATHLLQAALRRVLGAHIYQSGSLVAPDRFRFDFTHPAALTDEELAEVQRIVNDAIRRNLRVAPRMAPYREAIDSGAIALFDEKYGDEVRLVEILDDSSTFSAELCGGTHVGATGEIGFFQIVSESSIGAGMRRIEAVTGRGAEEFVEQRLSALRAVSRNVRSPEAEVEGAVTGILSEVESERRRSASLQRELSRREAESLLSNAVVVDGVQVVAARVTAPNAETLRQMGDLVRDKLGSGVVVLGAIYDDRPNFVTMVTPDLVAKGFHAGRIAKEVAVVAGGGGGGRAGLGQAGGKDKGKLDEALRRVGELLHS